MIDWQGLAQRKYDIMQQGANADTSRAGSTRIQAETQASLAPSAIAGTEADTALTRARAAGTPGLINSEIGLNNANAGLVGANTTGQQINNNAMSMMFSPEAFEAFARFAGLPTGTNLLERPMFQPVRTQPQLPAPTTTQARQPMNRGALSTVEDDNGIRVSRGLGMF
jgi:hypothetical protein